MSRWRAQFSSYPIPHFSGSQVANNRPKAFGAIESALKPQFTGTIGDFNPLGCCRWGTCPEQSVGLLPDRPDISNQNQELRSSTSVLPILAGEGDTMIPADSIAAILDSASPLPPEMMAPA
jgi:hypothetical protein